MRSFVKVTGLSMIAICTMMGLSMVPAFADAGDFVVTSMTAPAKGVEGTSVDVTIQVTETVADVGGGEDHAHQLPGSIRFDETTTSTKTARSTTAYIVGSPVAQPDAVGSTFTGVYLVSLPRLNSSDAPRTYTLTFRPKTDMYYPDPHGGSPIQDTDDPITGSVTIEVYPTPASEQLPEVPFAAVLPVIGLGGLVFGGAVLRRRKAN